MLALSEWLSSFAFSRRLKHLPRDFSDAVLMAELLAQLLPAGAVQLHNYPPASRFQQKLVNWETLNRKVLTPQRCELPHSLLEELASASPSAIALALVQVKKTIDPQTTSQASRSPSTKPSTEHTWKAPSSLSKTSIPAAKEEVSTRPVKTATSPRLQQQPQSPTKSVVDRNPNSPTRQPQPLLRDFLPLPQDRPTPEAMISTFGRVLPSPKSKPPKAEKQPQAKTSKPTTHPSQSTGAKLSSLDWDSRATMDHVHTVKIPSALSARATHTHDNDASGVLRRREWPASPTKPARPPMRFTTTELTRPKLSGVDLQAPLELRVADPSPPPAPPAPLNTTQAEEETIQLELCAPPTVFPRVQVDVDAVLSSSPRKHSSK